ncbi:hypothetical protein U5801_15340 [Lamprobacter modestohalophilus]|uniref:Uncharacterized protein n=1 Tax=Lamprobacter modestohalophilus TaxID=1064514 RepID=A0A9X0W9Y7_9GAMM|nr:hypothetical protein [Lamprobacter modestohalophilus]MBK1619611.1 hypothetical protein [Lamprobacter modestohalophilus]MEA1051167.1 hypothetical protein [Lamprobacter modestohalophilus]
MNTRLILPLFAALFLTLSGCGDGGNGDDGVAEPAGEGSTEPASEGSSSTMDAVKVKAQAAMDSAAEAGSQAMDALSEAAGVAKDQAEMLSAQADTETQDMIGQVKTYLEKNNLTSAEDLMAKLVELKDSLPESVREQIDALEGRLDKLQGQEQGQE